MSNETTTSILTYAEMYPHFSIDELFSYLHKKTDITRSSMLWYLFKLVDDKLLVRTGRGRYTKIIKQQFSIEPAKEVMETYSKLHTNFPFAKFCLYQGEILAPLQHHLFSNRIIYVETEKDSAETVFNFLKSEGREVYLRPDKDMIYHYVDMDSRAFFVKNLVSEAPLQTVFDVPMPTLEKLLVDIMRDSDFFYLQGTESENIIENAVNLYAINKSRLSRYADRRKVKDKLSFILNGQNDD